MTNDVSINNSDTQEENRAPMLYVTTFEGETSNGKILQGTFRDFFTGWSSRPVSPADTAKAGWRMLAPATFAGNRRSNANVQRVYLQVVEFDNTEKQVDENGKPRSVALAVDRRCTVAQAISFVRARGWESIVVTSYSHTPEHPKFRIYMTTTRPVLPDEHRRVQRHLHREFADAGMLPDPATMDPARPWYTPIRREGHEYIVEMVEGSPINVDALLAAVGPEIDTRQMGEADTRLRQWLSDTLKPAIDFTALLEAEGERLQRQGHYAKLWSPFRDDGNKPGCVVYNNDHYFDHGTLETIDAIGYMTRKREIDFWSACDVLADQYGVPRFERSKARLPAVIDPKEPFDALPNALPDTGREDLLRPVCKAIATLDEADRDVWITRVVERFGKCGRKANLDRKVIEKLVRGSQQAVRVTEDTTPIDTRYEVANGCLSLVEVREEGTRTRPLVNGTLRIESAITHDDGAEQRKFFRLVGALANGNPVAPFEVEQSKYDSLDWLTDKTNGRLRVEPGKALKDYLRHAVLTTSTYTDSTIYAHTGWREIDGRQVFLHAGGAIGSDGIEVELSDRLRKYVIAEPPAAFAGKREDDATAVRRESARTAIGASKKFLAVAPHQITAPLFASMVAAPIRCAIPGGQAAVSIIGRTGTRKTSLAVQGTRFFASGVRSDGDIPLNADSTATAIELLLHAAKDLPVVIDDAFPRGRRQDAERQIGLLRNVVHNYANGQVRVRASADVQLRVARAPRCGALWLTMEEDLLSPTTGESTSYRSLKVDIRPGDVALDKLSELQATDIGQGGRLYLEWLAANPQWRESAPRRYSEIVAELRKVEGLQARQPEVIASLVVGAEVYADHIVSLSREFGQFAIVDTWKDGFVSTIRNALLELAKGQTEIAKSQSPTARYIDNIRALIRTGRGEVLAANQPLSGHERAIGWYDDDTLAFECQALHAAVARLRDDNGESPPPAWRTIYRDLVSDGIAEKPTDDRHAGTRCSRGGGRGFFLVVSRKHFEDVPIGVGANNGLDPRFTGIDIEDMTSPSWKPTKGDA